MCRTAHDHFITVTGGQFDSHRRISVWFPLHHLKELFPSPCSKCQTWTLRSRRKPGRWTWTSVGGLTSRQSCATWPSSGTRRTCPRCSTPVRPGRSQRGWVRSSEIQNSFVKCQRDRDETRAASVPSDPPDAWPNHYSESRLLLLSAQDSAGR